jgi:hypothetical protein
MNAAPRSPVPAFPAFRVVAGIAVAILLAACGGTLPSSPPTVAPVPTTTLPPSPTLAPAATPRESHAAVVPTPTPPSTTTGWVDAGGDLPALDQRTLVALADGGAVMIGSNWNEGTDIPVAYRWAPSAASWEPIEALNKPRTRFGATLLRDGRVLVVGGLNNADQSYSSTYVLDPERPSLGWSKVGLLDTARTVPSIATLPDGRVLVAGGYFHTGARETALAPVRGTLGSIRGTPPWETSAARRGATDIDVPPYGYALATAELFDAATGEWTPTGSLNFARAGAPAVTLADGRVLIVGVGDDNLERVAPESYATAEIFDPATGTFALTRPLPALDLGRFLDLGVDLRDAYLDQGYPGRLVALPDGGALLVGRHHWAKHHADALESFRFDPSDASWRATGTPCAATNYNGPGEVRRTPTPCLIGGFVAGLSDGQVLSAGSGAWMEFEAEPRSTAVYEPATDAWIEEASLPGDYRPVTAVGLSDGTALVVAQTGDGPQIALRFIP